MKEVDGDRTMRCDQRGSVQFTRENTEGEKRAQIESQRTLTLTPGTDRSLSGSCYSFRSHWQLELLVSCIRRQDKHPREQVSAAGALGAVAEKPVGTLGLEVGFQAAVSGGLYAGSLFYRGSISLGTLLVLHRNLHL
jgi:hypothetical protein